MDEISLFLVACVLALVAIIGGTTYYNVHETSASAKVKSECISAGGSAVVGRSGDVMCIRGK